MLRWKMLRTTRCLMIGYCRLIDKSYKVIRRLGETFNQTISYLNLFGPPHRLLASPLHVILQPLFVRTAPAESVFAQ